MQASLSPNFARPPSEPLSLRFYHAWVEPLVWVCRSILLFLSVPLVVLVQLCYGAASASAARVLSVVSPTPVPTPKLVELQCTFRMIVRIRTYQCSKYNRIVLYVNVSRVGEGGLCPTTCASHGQSSPVPVHLVAEA